MPAPTRPGVANNYDAIPRRPTADNKGDVKVDQYFSSRLTAFFRYSQREYNQTDTPIIPLPLGADNSQGNVNIINKQGLGSLTYTLNPTSLLEFRMAVTRSIGGKWPLQAGLPNMEQEYGITGLPTDPAIAGGITTQNITGYQGIGRRSSTPQFQNPLVFNPKLNFSKIYARHAVKMGWEFQTVHTDILDFSPQYGQDSYGGQFSRPAGAAQADFYNVADFLFGARSSYALNNYVTVDYRQRMHFFYVQDDWKVNGKLTLNLGLRYEYATPQWEAQNRLSNFDPAARAVIQAKAGGIADRALVRPDRNNWGPRLGLAYNLTPKTVLRSAYGISYIHFNRMGGENMLSYNGPTVIGARIDQVPSNPLCTANETSPDCFRPTMMGYTASMVDPSRFSTLTARTNYTPPDYRTSYVQSWHFEIQRELVRNFVLNLAYVGNRGVGLMILADYNQARPNNPGENVVLLQRRPIPGFTDIQISWGGGHSSYHGFQAKLEKRFSGGFYLLNAFTWSKAIDNAAGHLEVYNGDNSRVNFYGLPNEKGLGSYNQPVNNTSTVVYEVPFGKGRRFGASAHPVAQAAIGGWRLTLINTMTSGVPVNLTYGPTSQFSVTGYPSYRPNITGEIMTPESDRTINNYFLTANILVPTDPRFPFGNAGRNIARAPAFYQADLGMHKEFPVWKESQRVEFRGEFFNLLNKTNFGAPNSTRTNAGFGTIRSTAQARVIQFALKYVF